MPSPVSFELCAEVLDACLAAREGGAGRIELCKELSVGGLTPDIGLTREVVERSGLPVHVLLRPSAETALASPEIFATVKAAMRAAAAVGAAGFVLGFLRADGQIDLENTRILVEEAAPLPVTFHRAFDDANDLEGALEDVIATGCRRLLTSGGAPDVLSGAPMLARLIRQAGSRLEVMAGGGLTLANAQAVVQTSGATHFHASLRNERVSGTSLDRRDALQAEYRQAIEQMIRTLNGAHDLIGSAGKRTAIDA